MSIVSKVESQRILSINYEENLSHNDLLSRITNDNEQVIMWYIGAYGLKEDAAKFYKEKMGAIRTVNPTAKFWLLDLTAWGAFKNTRVKITSSNKCGEGINKMQLSAIKCLTCAEIFGEMKSLKDPEVVKYFAQVVSRPKLQEPSTQFQETGIKINSVLEDFAIFDSLGQIDAAKCYSAIQYVEGSFIINQIAKSILFSGDNCNISFVLPNDEAKYYKDEADSFSKDTEILLRSTYGNALDGKSINVRFLNFQYGEETWHRPYNAGKKVLKKVTDNDII